MNAWRDWAEHAFAVGDAESELSEHQSGLVDRLVHELTRRGMTTPAIAFLEMSRPMHFIGAQAMHMLTPIVSAIADAGGYEELIRFLERRDAVDILLSRLEQLDNTAADPARDQAGTNDPASPPAPTMPPPTEQWD
ncbi:MAG: hypothetical protein KDA96_27330 [Planctomycetaceae bacterium]|nr:hypothetical protein [Planctomycetaceae bacterium]